MMPDFRELIINKALRSFPGVQYNAMLEEISESNKLVYELILPSDADWPKFRDAAYPAFARYLKARKLNVENPKNIAITIFHEGRCYQLEALEFIEAYKTIENLNKKTFRARVKEWQK
jgi:hypothetical protein